MKLIFLQILMFSCLVSFSCDVSNKAVKKIENKLISKDSKDVLLEINSEHTSDLDYLRGKTIYFRLYKDRFVEFDDFPTESRDNKQIDLEREKELKQFQINESDFDKITNILSNNEFRNLKSKYEKIESSCDAVPEVEIITTLKKIKIDWCDNLINPYNSPEFPKILSEIFKETYRIKSDLLGKHSSYL